MAIFKLLTLFSFFIFLVTSSASPLPSSSRPDNLSDSELNEIDGPVLSHYSRDLIKILSSNGFNSLASTLLSHPEFLSTVNDTYTLTVFAPSDEAFDLHHCLNLTLDLLKYHFSPVPIHPAALKFLWEGAELPTFADAYTRVTPDPEQTYINGITTSAVYEDTYMFIYKIDEFLNPQCRCKMEHNPCQSPNWYSNPFTFEGKGIVLWHMLLLILALFFIRSMSIVCGFIGNQFVRNRRNSAKKSQ